MKDVELSILLDVIFSNTKENLSNVYNNVITIINERYENRLREINYNIKE